MDSAHRQDQTPEPNHQSQEHHNNSASVNSPAYPQFANQSNNASSDEFNTFFNVPNDDGPGQSFNTSWDSSSIIDPRLQQQSFAQHTNSWNQPSIQNTSHLGNHGQGLNSAEFRNAFTTNSSPYFTSGYHNAPYQQFQGGAFNPIGYGSGSLLGNHSYPGVNGQSFGNQAIQGQTIAPSALQSYPTPFGNSEKNYFPALAARNNSGSIGASMETQSRRKPFDEDFALNAALSLPPGKPHGKLAIRDSKALADATESERLGKWVWIGKENLDSDDPKGVLPKITARKSSKEMKRTILENQGNEPFDARIRPALKKLKMSSKSQKSQTPAVSMGTQVASPSSDEESPSSEEGSDDDSEYDGAEPAQISPLPASRPQEPDKALEYDVIKVLWHKRRTQLTGSTIRGALGAYWSLIKPVRDAWKTEYSAISEAEAKNDKLKVEQHKLLANHHRKILEAGIQATAEHGHQDIVSKLSENANLFLSFYQLLVDRFKEGDINGRTVTTILNVMVRCTSMNQALLEKTKLDKVLPKLVKRGSEATQNLVQSVNKIVSSNSGTASVSVPAKPVKQESKPLNATTTGTGLLNGAKRQKDSEASPPAKKTTLIGQTKAASIINSKGASSGKSGTGPTPTAAVKADASKSTSTSSNLPTATQKTKTVVPKPASLLTGLQSASKKPGTSIASQKSSQAGEAKVKGVEAKKQPPQATISKPSFSFGDILANLDKPKEVEKTKKSAEDRPPENEEEKRKRLRKEARRHLRVKWKPEVSLVEIRLFRHDPEEETGHDSSMIRDATDVRNEGQMLKLHRGTEFDEEDDAMEEVELAPWHPLTLIDFAALPGPAQSDNFNKFGGKRVALSPEQKAQEQRELTTLIAVYSLASDIPYSPREPMDPYSGPIQEEKSFGEGGIKWDKVKSREKTFFASRAANPYMKASASAPSQDISSILSILSGRQQPPIPQQFAQLMVSINPQLNQAQTPQSSVLESIFAKFTPQAQASVAPTPQIDPTYMSAIDIFKQQQQLQQTQPQYLQTPVYQPPPQPPAPQQPPDLSALLAQFSQHNPSVQQPTYNFQPSYGNENDRKRPYDDGSNQEQQGESKRSKGKKVCKYPITRT